MSIHVSPALTRIHQVNCPQHVRTTPDMFLVAMEEDLTAVEKTFLAICFLNRIELRRLFFGFSDEQCLTEMVNHLTGDALLWYYTEVDLITQNNFKQVCKAFRRKYILQKQ